MTYYYVRQITNHGKAVTYTGTVSVSQGSGMASLYTSCMRPPTPGSYVSYAPESVDGVQQLSGKGIASVDWEVKFVPSTIPFTASISGVAVWHKLNT